MGNGRDVDPQRRLSHPEPGNNLGPLELQLWAHGTRTCHRGESALAVSYVSRYRRNEGVVDGGAASVRWSVVPTPVEMLVDESRRTVNVQNGGWVIVEPSTGQLHNEAQYLSGLHSL